MQARVRLLMHQNRPIVTSVRETTTIGAPAFRPRWALAVTVLACVLGSSCVERGDFGRVKASAWNELVGETGAIAAAHRGEPVSPNPLTDDEGELRGRAWRFLVPSRGRPWLDRVLAELVATRVVAPDLIEPDRRAYHVGLLAGDARSVTSLYRRLSEDAGADLRLVEPFGVVAVRVLAADRVRLAALDRIADVSPGDVAGALARVAENRCLIAWVTAASAFRLSQYRYALSHLVIEAPQADAGPTEGALARLAAERTRLVALGIPPLAKAACLGSADAPVAPPAVSAPPLPLVRKG